MKSTITISLRLAAVLTLMATLAVSCKKTEDTPTKQAVDQTQGVPKSKTVAEANTPVQQPPVASGLVSIDIKLPKPLFIGTPQNIEVPNLEKPLNKPRPAFLAPKGTVNLALHKPVTSSFDQPIIGELDMITNGDKEGIDGSYVELGPGVQFITIDLGAEADIYAIVVWHYHSTARVYKDVVVQVAADRDFINNVKTVYSNDDDNSAGLGIGNDKNYIETSEGRLIDVKGIRGRYVRLYSNGNNANDLNHYIEVEVYGKPVK
jgi:hypothetical protein